MLRRLIPLGVVAALIASGSADAQIIPRPTPTATPQPTPSPTAPVVTPAPTPSPQRTEPPLFATPTPSLSPSPDPGGSEPGESPAPSVGPPTREVVGGFRVPVIPRSKARNTRGLVDSLMRASNVGVEPQELLIRGMGRFPVAGLATYSDDWWNPRYTPVFHLHEGLDIFADFGTPIISPDKGVVTRVTQGPVGGLGVWVRGSDATLYYFAHMQFVSAGIEPGAPVEVGTQLGGVGNTGNADGGTPHLHMQIHPRGGGPVPPKPYVDSWLDEAINNADGFVNALVDGTIERREVLRSEAARAAAIDAGSGRSGASPEYAALAAVLDPMAGAVSVVPTLAITPAEVSQSTGTLVKEFVRQRVDGAILVTVSISDGNLQGDGAV